MRRETRVNLIFLVAFLAASLPGAVILFRKKLDPGASRMDQPDVMVTRLPYMAPPPAPPGVKWVVPDRTRAWLEAVTKGQTGSARMLSAVAPAGPQWEPLISRDHLLQVMAVARESGLTRIGLVVWDGWIEAAPQRFAVTVDGAAARVVGVDEIQIPSDVRRELVRLGYVRPPRRLLWINAESSTSGGTRARVALSYDGPPGPLHASVDFDLGPV